MTDWHNTKTGDRVEFTTRSVVGGNFTDLMRNKDIWMKYANRDNTNIGKWVEFPIEGPRVRKILTTADLEPMIWRYIMSEPGEDWETTGFDDSSWNEEKPGFDAIGTPYVIVGTARDKDQAQLINL